MKVSEIQGKPPHVLIFGPVGCGKTGLALTLGERAQVIDLDDGLLTGVTLKDEHQSARLKVDVRQFHEKEPQKKSVAFQAAKLEIFDIANKLSAGKYPFDALIIDSLSSLAESAVAQIMSNSGRPGQNPEIQHWGLAFTEIKNVFSVIRCMDIPVIVLAHDREGKEEGKIELALSGKNLPGQITRYFDEVWYMRVKSVGGGKVQRVVQTKSDGRVECRSRANIPDMTDTSVGMWALLAMMGYKPPEKPNGTQS